MVTQRVCSFFKFIFIFFLCGVSYICLFIDDCFLHFILQPPPPVNDTNPYNVFRPRERPNRLHTRRVSHLLYKLVKHFSWFISISELRGKDLVLTYLTGGLFLLILIFVKFFFRCKGEKTMCSHLRSCARWAALPF